MARYVFNGVARDKDGNVMASAKISVYLAGTTTAANVYTASTGGSAVTSVTSDSSGIFSFYVDDTVYYKSQRFKVSIGSPDYTTKSYDYLVVFPVLPLTIVDTDPADSAGSNGDIIIYEV